MRHLINTYIQADPAEELGELGELSLTGLIIKTGIHDAIARKLNKIRRTGKNGNPVFQIYKNLYLLLAALGGSPSLPSLK